MLSREQITEEFMEYLDRHREDMTENARRHFWAMQAILETLAEHERWKKERGKRQCKDI